MSKKITSIVLALCMMISCIAASSFTSNAVITDKESTSASIDPQDSIQGSAVLHCFDWSYNSIKANLADIKAAGYTAVQTSPVQPPKDYSASWTDQTGQWWKLYQPIDITVADGQTWLGTKAELKSLCTEAEKMGIKVIVDIVANHLGNITDSKGNSADNRSAQIPSELRNNNSYWHVNNIWADDSSRYNMTQGSIGEPDLNTGNSYIQQRYKNLLVELISLGVDGFRFDAAKHIELPTDSGCGSQFWPTVINGSQSSTDNEIFYYGEILNTAGTAISNYTKYMSITDNYSGDLSLVSANNKNASGLATSNYSKGAGAAKSVIWVESHDTYMGDSGSAGIKCTKSVSDSTITNAWAIVGSRANSTALFFARPAVSMGSASTNTTWKSDAVAEVNKFKNYFDGQSEYLSSQGSVTYNERGTSGVVISKLDGGGSVSLAAKKMKEGTYKDQVSGSTFTVSGGKISGTVGSSGVAVVYNAAPAGPSASVTPGSTTYKTDTLSLTLKYSNATSGQYSIDGSAYKPFTNGQIISIGAGVAYGTKTTVSVKASKDSDVSEVVTYTYTKVDPNLTQKVYFDNSSYRWSDVYAYIYVDKNTENAAWPGQKMTKDPSTGYYVLEVDDTFANGLVIFTESFSTATNRYPADGEDGMPLNGKNMLMKANYQWVEYEAPVPTTVQPTTAAPTTAVPTTAVPTTAVPTTAQPTTAAPTTAVPTTQPLPRILIGDVNFDGRITVSDATEIQMHIAEMIKLSSNALIAADVDKDGNISVKDATCVQCYVVELTNSSAFCGTYTGGNVNPTTSTAPTAVTQPETQPTTQPDDTEYIYAKGYTHAYFWNDTQSDLGGAWPGTTMESIGNNVYRAEIPAGATNVIFSNGGNGQTSDLTVPGAGKIYENGSWKNYGEQPQPQPTTQPSGKQYIYAKGYTHAYFWSDSQSDLGGVWPGTAMESVGNNVYRAEIPAGATSVIFSNSGNGQTSDLTIPGAGKIYENGYWNSYN